MMQFPKFAPRHQAELLFLLAFFIRMITYRFDYFLGYDPYFYYAVGREIIGGTYPEPYMLNNHPYGESLNTPLLFYFGVYFYKLISPLGFSDVAAFKILPALTGALMVVAVFLLGREMFGNKAGAISALILTFLPANLWRSFAGYYRGDVFFLLFLVLALYFLMLSTQKKYFILPSVLSLILLYKSWMGSTYGIIIYAVLATVLLSAKVSQGKAQRAVYLSALGFILLSLSITFDPTSFMARIINASYAIGVVETLPLNLKTYASSFGLTGLLLPFSFLYACTKLESNGKEKAFLLIWASLALFMVFKMVRLSFLASVPVALLVGYWISEIDNKKRFISIFLLGIIALQGTGFAVKTQPSVSIYWIDALEYLATQEKGGVLTWWDYGYWIQGIAGFPTAAQGGKSAPSGRVMEFFLSSNKTVATKILRENKIKYVVVSTELMGRVERFPKRDYTIYSYNSLKEHGVEIQTYGDRKATVFMDRAIEKTFERKNGSVRGYLLVNHEKNIERSTVYLSDGELYIKGTGNKSVMIYIPDGLDETVLTSLILLDGKYYPELFMIYRNPEVKIYKVLDLSNIINKEK